MDFPLGFHKQAFKAHEAGNCAGDQGKFWEMHDMIFENQKTMQPEDLMKHAEKLGLDMAAFKNCLDSEKYAEEIRKDMAEGQKAGVRGTPSFLIGYTNPNDGTKIKAVKFVRGAQPYSKFKEEFDSLLKEEKKK